MKRSLGVLATLVLSPLPTPCARSGTQTLFQSTKSKDVRLKKSHLLYKQRKSLQSISSPSLILPSPVGLSPQRSCRSPSLLRYRHPFPHRQAMEYRSITTPPKFSGPRSLPPRCNAETRSSNSPLTASCHGAPIPPVLPSSLPATWSRTNIGHLMT